jgi:hypothetical protein
VNFSEDPLMTLKQDKDGMFLCTTQTFIKRTNAPPATAIPLNVKINT